MDQHVIDLTEATEEQVVVRFPIRPEALVRLGARDYRGNVQDVLAVITHSADRIDASRDEIRTNARKLERNLAEFETALADLELARDDMNVACALAMKEAEKAARMRDWVERSARAMEDGDIAAMERLRGECQAV